MSNDIQGLISLMKQKRQSSGYSIRKLSRVIGISFSSLARIERGDGLPDNYSQVKIMEWRGEEIPSNMEKFKTNKKQSFGLLPRHLWLKERIKDCISALQSIEKNEDWDFYLTKSLEFANEIKYACEEWEKYYDE